MQIFISSLSGKAPTALMVNSYNTVNNVKAMIHKAEGIPSNMQSLLFLGNELEDCDTLSHYRIINGSTLHLIQLSPEIKDVQTNIKIKTLTGKIFDIEVELSDTIRTVKEKIEEKDGVPSSQQRLVFGDKQLQNDKPLSEYSITGGSALHLVLQLRGGSGHGMKIFVETVDGEKITVEAEPSHTVENVKVKIHEKAGIRPDMQLYIFGNKLLDDTRTLSDYSIQDGSSVLLIIRTLCDHRIYVGHCSACSLPFHDEKCNRALPTIEESSWKWNCSTIDSIPKFVS